MKRSTIAAVWIAGATAPLLMATIFIFGCCILPFHHVIHKVLPLCSLAAGFMRGEHAGHDDGEPSTPAREKQEPVKRFVIEVPRTFTLIHVAASRPIATSPATSYRSFITLGAVRCDQDVGLHLLDQTLLI